MKKLPYILMNSTNWILAGLLSLLGFSSCNEQNEGGGEMYGVPHAEFSIKGKVVDSKGAPLSGIQIHYATAHTGDGRTWHEQIPEKFTSENGAINNHFESFPTKSLRVYATDIDGPVNGSFANDSIDIEISKTDYKGGKGWFSGTVEKDIILTLKEKE